MYGYLTKEKNSSKIQSNAPKQQRAYQKNGINSIKSNARAVQMKEATQQSSSEHARFSCSDSNRTELLTPAKKEQRTNEIIQRAIIPLTEEHKGKISEHKKTALDFLKSVEASLGKDSKAKDEFARAGTGAKDTDISSVVSSLITFLTGFDKWKVFDDKEDEEYADSEAYMDDDQIALHVKTLDYSTGKVAFIIIHEASHICLQTEDYGYISNDDYYVNEDEDGNEYEDEEKITLPAEKAIKNADTIAHIITKLNGATKLF